MDLHNQAFQMVVTIVTSVLASSGFWAFIQRYFDKNDTVKRLLIGIGHDRIMTLGLSYVQRGYITADEYENLHDYLYLPYVENGGNGSAKRLMAEVDKLPIRQHGTIS